MGNKSGFKPSRMAPPPKKKKTTQKTSPVESGAGFRGVGDARAGETELGEGRLELGGFGSEGGGGDDDDDDGLFQAFGRHRHP